MVEKSIKLKIHNFIVAHFNKKTNMTGVLNLKKELTVIEKTAIKIEALDNQIFFLRDSLERLCNQAANVKKSGKKDEALLTIRETEKILTQTTLFLENTQNELGELSSTLLDLVAEVE